MSDFIIKKTRDYIKWYADSKNLRKFHKMLTSRSENNSEFFFVQIGSCDGVAGDPIHDYAINYHWSGVLVEPVKYLFEKLVRNYLSEKRLKFENSAIADENGQREFYYLRQSNELLPSWYDQLGSFSVNIVLKHKVDIPHIESLIVVETVPTITLERLINKYSIKSMDLLHIDTEGYDYEILKQIRFINVKPKMILFENRHLTPSDSKACENYLKRSGYSVIRMGVDTFAFISWLTSLKASAKCILGSILAKIRF